MATKNITDLQVLQAYEKARGGHRYIWPEEILQHETNECEKVCFRAMERACDRGLIEYGVTMRSGWLTDKGRQLLEGRVGE